MRVCTVEWEAERWHIHCCSHWSLSGCFSLFFLFFWLSLLICDRGKENFHSQSDFESSSFKKKKKASHLSNGLFEGLFDALPLGDSAVRQDVDDCCLISACKTNQTKKKEKSLSLNPVTFSGINLNSQLQYAHPILHSWEKRRTQRQTCSPGDDPNTHCLLATAWKPSVCNRAPSRVRGRWLCSQTLTASTFLPNNWPIERKVCLLLTLVCACLMGAHNMVTEHSDP